MPIATQNRILPVALALSLAGCLNSGLRSIGQGDGGIDGGAGDAGQSCPAGEDFCAGACTNTQTDPANCGRCRTPCPAGLACTAGSCCPPGQTLCAGLCTTTQSDPKNCGSCGTGCLPGLTCVSGVCQLTCPAADAGAVVLASSQGQPYDLVVDQTSVYWTDYKSGDVMKVAIGGGTPVTLAAPPASSTFAVDPDYLAIDRSFVYYGIQDNDAVMRVDLDGGIPAQLAIGGGDWPAGLALDPADAYAYWVINSNGLVQKVAVGGGAPITLVPASTSQDSCRLAGVDGTSVYWTCKGSGLASGTVMKVGLDGGAPATVASGLEAPVGGAVDATSVYFASNLGTEFAVEKVAIGGGSATTLASSLGTIYGLTVDSSNVYWAGDLNNCETAVMKVGLDGGVPVVLISAQPGAFDVAVDATSVYWTDQTAGTVAKLTPK